MIDWNSSKNEILFNPRMPAHEKEKLFQALSSIDNYVDSHVLFATSGSSGKLKWVALAKSAILCSAQAVNRHLNTHSADIWLNPLPDFHVGGQGILARAYLSQARVVNCFQGLKWNPEHFFGLLEEYGATLTALVPAQVFDLVSLQIKAPKNLRAVVVGGGALSEQVYFSAIKLGWNLLPSYGLTECASQVATAECDSMSLTQYPLLRPLDHVQLAIDEDGYLKIKSDALLTAYFESDERGVFSLFNPKNGEWFRSEDIAEFELGSIKKISRGAHFIKIGGESVDMLRLEKILEEEKLNAKSLIDMALIAKEDERLGFRIHLFIDSPINETVQTLVDRYHQRVFPFERISHIHSVNKIPRSPLNKVLKAELNKY